MLEEQQGEPRHTSTPTHVDRRGHQCKHTRKHKNTSKCRQTRSITLSVLQVILIPSQLELLVISLQRKKDVLHSSPPVCPGHETHTSLFGVCAPHWPVCPRPRWDLSPACATPYPQNAEQIHPASSKLPPSLPPNPRPRRQRKEQESIEMNGQPIASWLELNGNVKLATDPFCLSVEGLVSPGSPNRVIPS